MIQGTHEPNLRGHKSEDSTVSVFFVAKEDLLEGNITNVGAMVPHSLEYNTCRSMTDSIAGLNLLPRNGVDVWIRSQIFEGDLELLGG